MGEYNENEGIHPDFKIKLKNLEMVVFEKIVFKFLEITYTFI